MRRHHHPTYWQRGSRRVQSFVDSVTCRLRRALAADPALHARLNAEIKRRKTAEEPRRLLAGVHDVDDFAYAIAKSVRAAAEYWRDDHPDPHRVERETTLELIEQHEKGGRKAALRVLRSAWWRDLAIRHRTTAPALLPQCTSS